MSPASRVRLAAVALAVVALPASTVVGARTASGTVELSGSHEVNVRMEAGWTARYNWTTGEEAVYFDIHTHRDGVEYLERNESSTAMNGSFTVDRRGTYSLSWQHRGGTATLDWQLDGRFVGMDEDLPDEDRPPRPSVPLVLGAIAAIAVAGTAAALWARKR